MTPHHHKTHDARVHHARALYVAADAMHARALAQMKDAIRHADADEWDAAEVAMQASRRSEATAAELTAAADAS